MISSVGIQAGEEEVPKTHCPNMCTSFLCDRMGVSSGA
jgi:hypothetical protein